jgi:replicative DNA helicase
MVWLLYRDDSPGANPLEAEVLIAKQRNGPSGGTIDLRWDPTVMRFTGRL